MCVADSASSPDTDVERHDEHVEMSRTMSAVGCGDAGQWTTNESDELSRALDESPPDIDRHMAELRRCIGMC
jgi:hypothetical protein